MRIRRAVLVAVLAASSALPLSGCNAERVQPQASAAPTTTATPSPSFTYDPAGLVAQLAHTTVLPACMAEDASYGPMPCRWDATTVGNHRGKSFAVVPIGPTRVAFIYDDGTRRDADR
jgi:hypothetical protein